MVLVKKRQNRGLKVIYQVDIHLEKTETLRKEKYEEIKSFTHVTLPITYFLDHTFLDFMSMQHKSPILEDTAPTGTKKILLPKC